MPLLPFKTFLRMARDRGARRENCGATCTASQPSLCLYCCGGVAVPNPVIDMEEGSLLLGSMPAKRRGRIPHCQPMPEKGTGRGLHPGTLVPGKLSSPIH